MGAPSDQDDFEFPDWHRAYHAAVLETDRVKVLNLVEAVESVISERLKKVWDVLGMKCNDKRCLTLLVLWVS
jgi:hypothetical protein